MGLHRIVMRRPDVGFVMKHDIIIKRSHLDRFRIWASRGVETLGWLLSLGLIAAGLFLAGSGALVWLFFGHDALLGSTLLGGVLLVVTGCLVLLRRMDSFVGVLRKRGISTEAGQES